MANKLPKDKQIAVISALAEGCSIRAIARITGIHQDTICRLGVRVGQGCAALLDAKMHDLTCRYLQLDEIWGFIGKKEKHLSIGEGFKGQFPIIAIQIKPYRPIISVVRGNIFLHGRSPRIQDFGCVGLASVSALVGPRRLGGASYHSIRALFVDLFGNFKLGHYPHPDQFDDIGALLAQLARVVRGRIRRKTQGLVRLARYLRWKLLDGNERRRAKRCGDCQHSNSWAIDGTCFYPLDFENYEYCFCREHHHATTRETRLTVHGGTQ